MKIQSFLILTGLLAAFFLSVPVYSDEAVEVTTVGVSMAGRESSRREAVEDALRNAVEEAIGTFVTVDLIVENKQIVDEKILSRTRGYIRQYSVIHEEERGGLYKVRVNAFVKTEKIRDDLLAAGLLMQRKQMPRIMVVVPEGQLSETLLQDKQYVDSVRNIIEKRLLQNKFLLADYRQHVTDRSLAAAGGDTNRLLMLAKDAGAELLIVAEGTRYFDHKANLYGSMYKLYRPEVHMRVVETGTGKVIYSGTMEGEISATLEALYDTAEQLSAQAAEAILQKWSGDVSNATNLKLFIHNIEFSQLSVLEKSLRSMNYVTSLHRRAYAAREASYDVDFRGNADTFAERLLQLSNIRLIITGISQQTVEAEIKP
jgi:hypothetical protein